MESRGPNRRFTPPWMVVRADADTFVVETANGIPVAYVACRDDMQDVTFAHNRLSSDEARRIAQAIARIPEFLMLRRGFHSRRSGKRWNPKRPYHVAIEDSYLRGHWGEINALCKFNGIPQNTTGERMGDHSAGWVVFEFSEQMDAILFWDAFNGRWLLGDNFVYPPRPDNLPTMKKPPHWRSVARKPERG